MTIEPHNAVTVSIRSPLPFGKAKTIADYQATIIAKHGKMPSMEELARLERGGQAPFRPYVPFDANGNAGRAATISKGEATRDSVMGVMSGGKEMTSRDIANATGRTQQLINRHLVILASQGKIAGQTLKGIVLWRLAL